MKTIKILVALFLLFFLLKGHIFRFFIEYKTIGERQPIELSNDKLINQLVEIDKPNKLDFNSIIYQSSIFTNEKLHFSFKSNVKNNPNTFVEKSSANCIGYAALFASSCNFHFQKNNLSNKYRAEHHIGKLSFLGFDMHKYFNSPFFKDHDFVLIKNEETGQSILAIDPSLSDFIGINSVRFH